MKVEKGNEKEKEYETLLERFKLALSEKDEFAQKILCTRLMKIVRENA